MWYRRCKFWWRNDFPHPRRLLRSVAIASFRVVTTNDAIRPSRMSRMVWGLQPDPAWVSFEGCKAGAYLDDWASRSGLSVDAS